ncbi:hypothetical protein GO287_02041 [Ralstonia solanacearum]|uniref:hypothetical protein n=1 Tax=Ralstonia pseudosolanacearum TaxID=1310165 RepID=UPI0014029B2C|nr:hypothetical protein [Ralstonia pseudosolanacearum]KAF3461262.1 hypothetical protein GO278_000765 [Ralstonia solanacearum]NKA77639.1 hypothetical protein [Ralstonia solanacearum]NKG00113.1 hypothetical protein [Ralstonia solanacearum]NKG04835.1 hypothetical protein [Ralstonia solanacearum]UNJ30235.1 hypothetical protein MNY32_02650 [Ralstonia pseudosolanacearum]
MDEKEKNTRLRWSKDLPPDAQAARRKYMDILKADDSVPELKDAIALVDAAARLGCTRNELLDEGSKGERVIYAPVLDDALYAWPVTDRGMQHSRVLGMAIPVFRRRLDERDKGILLRSDIERLKQGVPIIPEGYVLPKATLQCIETWEAEQPEAFVLERMRELVKTVAWVHPSKLSSERDRWPLPTRLLGIEMLLVSSDGIPTPVLLTIKELAGAFEQYLRNVQSKRKISDWAGIFQKPIKAMLSAKEATTTQGKVGKWKPVEVGIVLREEYDYPWVSLNRAFRRHELLRLWWAAWAKETRHRGNERVDEPEGEPSPTSPFGGN